MTTETTGLAQAVTTYEILRTEERDDGLHHLYRWRVERGQNADGAPLPPAEGTAWASEPIEPMSRAILDDRWEGLTGSGDSSKLLDRLDKVLSDFAERLSRRDISDHAVIDGEIVGLDVVFSIDDLEQVIREWLTERAAKVAGR